MGVLPWLCSFISSEIALGNMAHKPAEFRIRPPNVRTYYVVETDSVAQVSGQYNAMGANTANATIPG